VARSHPKIAHHCGSFVDPEPRRHRPGVLVKTASLRQPERELPAVQTMQRWNPAANSDIVAVRVVPGDLSGPVQLPGCWRERR
jgi:hypothetical protein